MLTKCSDLSEKAGSIAQRNSAKACDPALKELCLRSALFGESYFPKTREAQSYEFNLEACPLRAEFWKQLMINHSRNGGNHVMGMVYEYQS
jgi:hypothetical protein